MLIQGIVGLGALSYLLQLGQPTSRALVIKYNKSNTGFLEFWQKNASVRTVESLIIERERERRERGGRERGGEREREGGRERERRREGEGRREGEREEERGRGRERGGEREREREFCKQLTIIIVFHQYACTSRMVTLLPGSVSSIIVWSLTNQILGL